MITAQKYPRLIRALLVTANDADTSWAVQVVESAMEGRPFATALVREAFRKRHDSYVQGSLREKGNANDVPDLSPTYSIRTDVA